MPLPADAPVMKRATTMTLALPAASAAPYRKFPAAPTTVDASKSVRMGCVRLHAPNSGRESRRPTLKDDIATLYTALRPAACGGSSDSTKRLMDAMTMPYSTKLWHGGTTAQGCVGSTHTQWQWQTGPTS
jgi:hypothetical protein